MAEFLGGYTPGFRGSVVFKSPWMDGLTHAVARRDHRYTVCGEEITRVDDRHMCSNGDMKTVTCLRCWTRKDPFP